MGESISHIDIHHVISAINPDLYCESSVRKKVKRLLGAENQKQNSRAFLEAAAIAEPIEPTPADLQDPTIANPFSLEILKSPVSRTKLVIDTMDEPIEAIYFNLLDAIQRQVGWTVEKLEDSMTATPGSTVTADFTQNRIHAQRQAMDLFRNVHELVHLILQGLAELEPEGSNEDRTERGELSGRSKRTIQVAQLQAMFNQLRLYARWLQPWLSASESFQTDGRSQAALANAFNSAQFKITLLATKEVDIEHRIASREFPYSFRNRRIRTCLSAMVVELNVRAAPNRQVSGGHRYSGRTELRFDSYALNTEEIRRLRSEMDRQAISEMLFFAGNPLTSVVQLIEAMDRLFGGKPGTAAEQQPEDNNPFTALWTFLCGLFDGRRYQRSPNDSAKEAVIRAAALMDAHSAVAGTVAELKRRMGAPRLRDSLGGDFR